MRHLANRFVETVPMLPSVIARKQMNDNTSIYPAFTDLIMQEVYSQMIPATIKLSVALTSNATQDTWVCKPTTPYR